MRLMPEPTMVFVPLSNQLQVPCGAASACSVTDAPAAVSTDCGLAVTRMGMQDPAVTSTVLESRDSVPHSAVTRTQYVVELTGLMMSVLCVAPGTGLLTSPLCPSYH